MAASPPTSQAAATERIMVNWYTGLAIGGYDSVAFFTDGKPMAGSVDFELRYGGAIWRFSNVSNRAAFAARQVRRRSGPRDRFGRSQIA